MIDILSHLFPRPTSSLAELRVQLDRAQARIAEIGWAQGSTEREAELRTRNRELQQALRREIARLRAAESIHVAAPRR